MPTLTQYRTNASLYNGPFGPDVGWAAAGMGYWIKTDGGRFIVIDGGHGEDAEDLLSLLTTQNGGAVPEVALWIITHPHLDHYGALLAIASDRKLSRRVCIRKIVWYFPPEFRTPTGADILPSIRDMERILRTAGAQSHLPQAGESLTVDGILLKFLFVPTDCSALDNPNQLSLIFTVCGAQKKLMITGDAYFNTLQTVLEQYPEDLPCDILQLPHHGLCDTGHEEFYRCVNAETVLIPISVAGERTMAGDLYGDAPAANRFAARNAKTVIHAFEGTVSLPF